MRPPAIRASFEPDELLVDSFAGGGGASLGASLALGRPIDIAINHNPTALRMHERNHPETRHFVDDIWTVDPKVVCGERRVGLLWCSPDCRHHSRAKGGKPVDKKIRGLAWVATRWARAVRPRCIVLENVIELESWGPLGPDNKPDKSKAGRTFQNFVTQLRNIGYAVEWRRLIAADYGAPTTRLRLYLIARCDGEPIIWPEATHRKHEWIPASTIIDWDLPALSIFDPNRPKKLVEPTMARIAKGIDKYVVKAASPFIVRHGHYSTITGAGLREGCGAGTFRGQPLDQPLGTVCATNDKDLVLPIITESYGSPNRKSGGGIVLGRQLTLPLSTVTARPHHALAIAKTAGDRREQVRAFMLRYNGTGVGADLQLPLPTITSKPRFGLVLVDGVEYPLADILFRMLAPRELYRAQGFPDSYLIDGFTVEEQIRMCGNSVVPAVARAIVAANLLGERAVAA